MDDCDVFWCTIDYVLDTFHLTFPCHEHKNDAIAKIIHYYVAMHMRHALLKHETARKQQKRRKCQGFLRIETEQNLKHLCENLPVPGVCAPPKSVT